MTLESLVRAGRNLVPIAVLLAAVTAGTMLYLFDPAKTRLFPPCPFRWLTGLYCPGCGSLRAVHQLLHGHLLRAIDLNPLTVLLLPLVVAMILKPNRFRQPWLGQVLLWVIIIFAIARNLPIYPCCILAP